MQQAREDAPSRSIQTRVLNGWRGEVQEGPWCWTRDKGDGKPRRRREKEQRSREPLCVYREAAKMLGGQVWVGGVEGEQDVGTTQAQGEVGRSGIMVGTHKQQKKSAALQEEQIPAERRARA
jgi:hypothetical protein